MGDGVLCAVPRRGRGRGVLDGGGVTKLVDRKNGRIVRLPNPKYPHDYLTSRDKILAQKDEIAAFYQDRT